MFHLCACSDRSCTDATSEELATRVKDEMDPNALRMKFESPCDKASWRNSVATAAVTPEMLWQNFALSQRPAEASTTGPGV